MEGKTVTIWKASKDKESLEGREAEGVVLAAVAASSGIKPGSNGTQCALGKMMLWGMDVGWGR